MVNIAVMKTVSLPVKPWRGFRDTDSYGSGVFGASRDGGARKHLGRDLISQPGDLVVAPFPCVLKRIGLAYPALRLLNDSILMLHLLELEGLGGFAGWKSRLLYVGTSLAVGTPFEEGDHLGEAENVTAYYTAKNPGEAKPMTNHVHWEVSIPVDPGALVASIPLQVTT